MPQLAASSFSLRDVLAGSSRHSRLAKESSHRIATTVVSSTSCIAMGIWEAFADIVEAVTPWSVVEAEAPAEEPKVRCVLSALVFGNS